MRNFTFLITAMMTITTHAVLAQSSSLSGKIKDGEAALPGTTVQVEGTNIGTSTDYKGNFELNKLKAGDIKLIISFVGYEPRTMEVSLTDNEHKDLGTILLNVDIKTLEDIVVLGDIVRGEMRSLNTMKNSNKIVSVISSDAIGKLPDRNAAEAVQRMPGVSIERDQGEGRFVAVRGLPAQWSSTNINGNRLPTAEEETTNRATAFDFFPSDMIEVVEVSKTLTPDQEGDAMGGSVNFITRTAPDDKTLNVAIGGGYNSLSGKPIFSGNVLLGDKSENGKFGYLINGTAWIRNWASDTYEPRRAGDSKGIKRLELRDYTGIRETYGVNGALEYNPTDNTKIYFRGIFGTLIDSETHYKHRMRFDKDRVEVQHIFNDLTTRLFGGEVGANHKIGSSSKLEWKLATYENEFKYGDIPNNDDNSYFVVRFDQKNVGYEGLEKRDEKNYAYNKADGGSDPWDNISNHLPAGFQMSPSATKLSWVELYKIYIKERDKIIANIDFTHTISNKLEIKLGAKYRNKERIATFSDEFYSWDASKGPVPTLADFNLVDQPGRSDYFKGNGPDYQAQFSQVVSKDDIISWYNKNKNNLKLDHDESYLVSNGSALGRHFDVREQHTSVYGMGTYKASDNLTFVGGVRLSNTSTEVDGQTYLATTKTLEPKKEKKSYMVVLPALIAKLSPTDDMNIKFAVTRSFARPDFGDLSPGGSYAEHDNVYKSGNPSLNPTFSWNIDLMVEKYYGRVGFLSGGVFYKSLQDPIFKDKQKGNFKGRSGVDFIRPLNGESGSILGFEVAVKQQFDFFSGFFSKLGIDANYTYMKSELTIPGRKDKVRIPRQANGLFNAGLYYDDSKFATRIALNYKGAYITEHGSTPQTDSFYGQYTSMDWSGSYKVSPKVQIYAELNNLLNDPLIYYLGVKERPLQVEYYRIRYC